MNWRMWWQYGYLAVFAAASGAVAERIDPQVIGGRPVDDARRYPYMVALVSSGVDDTTEAHFCGGTLIGPDLVLTAGHCISTPDGGIGSPPWFEVVAGTTVLPFNRGKRIAVTGIARHPQYNPVTIEHDVAVLRLAKSLPGPYATIASVLDAELYESGKAARILGWGTQHPVYPRLPVRLQVGDIPMFNDLECVDRIGRFFKPETMTCAGKLKTETEAPVGACFGDSGGPLLGESSSGELIQIGVASWGFRCDPEFPGVYADLAELNGFVTADHTFAPYSISPPVIEGEPIVGNTLTCNPGIWGGDPVESYSFQWTRDFANIDGAVDTTYTPVDADVGTELVCVVTARNGGGEAIAYSQLVVVAPVTVTPPPPSDTTPPTAAVKSFSCKGRVCTLVLHAEDSGDINSVASVEGVVIREKRTKCKKGVKKPTGCSANTVSEADAVALRGGDWRITVGRYDRRSESLLITTRARDTAGNLQDPPTVVKRRREKR